MTELEMAAEIARLGERKTWINSLPPGRLVVLQALHLRLPAMRGSKPFRREAVKRWTTHGVFGVTLRRRKFVDAPDQVKLGDLRKFIRAVADRASPPNDGAVAPEGIIR